MMKLAAFWAIVLNVQSLPALEPFTVTDVSRQFDSTGSVVSESRFLFARNNEGSIASVDLDPNSGGVRQVINVTARRTLLIDPSSHSATEMDRGAMTNTSEPCESRFRAFVGAEVSVDRSARRIADVPVERITVNQSNGTVLNLVVAPSLGCHMLEATTTRQGRTVERKSVENLRLGDPDPSLFEVPVGYRLNNAKFQGMN
jgi:hypothetical protein